ncbi:MAG: cation:proton antiporter [Dehalococcoidia bacterium]|jgi:multicomponent Na+:H+ antiporter subunit F|nr:cation:proton antiporter [Dehalococcoidia bacterium]
MNGSFPVNGFIEVTAMLMMSAGLVLAMVRLVRGPSLPDRVVALDLITMLGLGMLAVYSMSTERTAYLDVGIVLTLVTFIATISFAYFIEKGTGRGGGN